MSRTFYSEINLHFVWHTKNNAPLLTPDIEILAHRFIRKRIVDFDGIFVHAIGGIENHVHIAVTVPPTLTPSDFIGKIKGGSAHDVNHHDDGKRRLIEWQVGYGVVSFGTRDLDWVVKYIKNQRDHHAKGSVFDRLERAVFIEDSRSDQTNG